MNDFLSQESSLRISSLVYQVLPILNLKWAQSLWLIEIHQNPAVLTRVIQICMGKFITTKMNQLDTSFTIFLKIWDGENRQVAAEFFIFCDFFNLIHRNSYILVSKLHGFSEIQIALTLNRLELRVG